MLSEAIARGYVEQVPVISLIGMRRTGLGIGRRKPESSINMDPPDDRPGWWNEVDSKDLIEPGEKIH
jgi:hypothetical protein